MRAHPDEAFLKNRWSSGWATWRGSWRRDAPNILVIGGHEDVSSYALMPGLAGGLVWISSIGVDMVARGIPVLVAARPKYHELGLVDEPASVTAYFDAVTRLATAGPPRPKSSRPARDEYLNLVFAEFSFDAFSRVLSGERPLPRRSRGPARCGRVLRDRGRRPAAGNAPAPRDAAGGLGNSGAGTDERTGTSGLDVPLAGLAARRGPRLGGDSKPGQGPAHGLPVHAVGGGPELHVPRRERSRVPLGRPGVHGRLAHAPAGRAPTWASCAWG